MNQQKNKPNINSFSDIQVKSNTNIFVPSFPINKTDLDKIFPLFVSTCNLLVNGEHPQMLYALNTLQNILRIAVTQSELRTNIFQYFFEQNLHLFLISQFENPASHPFIIKGTLQTFNLIMKSQPEIISEFLSSNFHDRLIALLPSKEALECIQTMFLNHEEYHNSLITNNFHLQIIQHIKQLHHIESPFKYWWESDYILFLAFLQPYIHFEEETYLVLIQEFIALLGLNDEEEPTLSNYNYYENPIYAVQLSVMQFLLHSDDETLIKLICCHPDNILLSILSSLNERRYLLIADSFFKYLEKVVCTSNEYASIFANPDYSGQIEILFTNDSLRLQTVHLISAICRELNEKCDEFITLEIFRQLNSTLSSDSWEIQRELFPTFLVMLQNDQSSFFPFFLDPQLFNYQAFFDLANLILDSESDEKELLLAVILHILKCSNESSNQFLNQVLMQYLLTEDFYDHLRKISENEDNEKLASKAQLLLEQIDELS